MGLDQVRGRIRRDAPLPEKIGRPASDPARQTTEGLDVGDMALLDARERVEGHACFRRRRSETNSLRVSSIFQEFRQVFDLKDVSALLHKASCPSYGTVNVVDARRRSCYDLVRGLVR